MGNRKGTRHANRRQVAQAAEHTDQAMDYLIQVGAQYEAAHPEMYRNFVTIVQALDGCKTTIKALRLAM